MGGRKKHLHKELVGVIEKYFAFAQIAVDEVVSLKSDHVALLFERHHSEVIEGKCHTKKFSEFLTPFKKACHRKLALKYSDLTGSQVS
jgi:hypothetical protein